MSKPQHPPTENSAANRSPIGSPRNFVLACIGLASLLADEIPALLERSVQRGNAVLERAQGEAERRRAAPPDVTPRLSHDVQSELSRLGLPTHHDFEMLLQQVAELEQQIDQIAAQRAAGQ
jgi:hypothetical protein